MKRVKAMLALAALAAALAGCFPPALGDAEMSDAGIRSRLEQSLHAHRELDLHAVTIDVHLHIVTISGIVSSWQDKRLIEAIVREIAGIEQASINLVVPE
ncbi:MAG: BON domain-containing protein [Elusimicrobia bacterium]|nr:BON domain-containing protein [Elusimicrobiota bacterium]